ncbi:MAG: M56 family metallopeptidase [Nitriliruptoraceae bacterium]
MDLGVLFSLPLESVAIRAVLATLLAGLVARALLRRVLSCPQVRVIAAIAPLLALTAVVLLSGTQLRLPMVMLPAEGAHAVTIPVPDGYLHFVPLAVPLVAGIWAIVALLRLLRRGLAHRRTWVEAREALARSPRPPVKLVRLAERVAVRMKVATPALALVNGCRGGAYIVGTRAPILVLSEELLQRLDAEELEGVIAHELAHVRRRDTPVAAALGSVRDLMFFVPGAGWAVRQLHRERERAADLLAVRTTGRPGALASGLLKVLEEAPAGHVACAPLAPAGSVVERVRLLVDDGPPPRRGRRLVEASSVTVLTVVAVIGALIVPGTWAGPERERDALALVWSSAAPVPSTAAPAVEARAFHTYRRTALEVAAPARSVHGRIAEHSQDNRRAVLHACADASTTCPVPQQSVSLGLRPASITYDEPAFSRWEARQVGGDASRDGFRVFVLANQPG